MIIKIENWPDGFKLISFAKLQMDVLGIGLKEAKDNADRLMKGETIYFDISDLKIANDFIFKAAALDVVCLTA